MDPPLCSSHACLHTAFIVISVHCVFNCQQVFHRPMVLLPKQQQQTAKTVNLALMHQSHLSTNHQHNKQIIKNTTQQTTTQTNIKKQNNTKHDITKTNRKYKQNDQQLQAQQQANNTSNSSNEEQQTATHQTRTAWLRALSPGHACGGAEWVVALTLCSVLACF